MPLAIQVTPITTEEPDKPGHPQVPTESPSKGYAAAVALRLIQLLAVGSLLQIDRAPKSPMLKDKSACEITPVWTPLTRRGCRVGKIIPLRCLHGDQIQIRKRLSQNRSLASWATSYLRTCSEAKFEPGVKRSLAAIALLIFTVQHARHQP
jgi:hypothetical protein